MDRQRSAVDLIVTNNVILMMIMFGIIENEFLCLGKNASRHTKRRFVNNCHFWILLAFAH